MIKKQIFFIEIKQFKKSAIISIDIITIITQNHFIDKTVDNKKLYKYKQVQKTNLKQKRIILKGDVGKT